MYTFIYLSFNIIYNYINIVKWSRVYAYIWYGVLEVVATYRHAGVTVQAFNVMHGVPKCMTYMLGVAHQRFAVMKNTDVCDNRRENVCFAG